MNKTAAEYYGYQVGRQGVRLAFALCVGGAVMAILYLANQPDLLIGVMGGAVGMKYWVETP